MHTAAQYIVGKQNSPAKIMNCVQLKRGIQQQNCNEKKIYKVKVNRRIQVGFSDQGNLEFSINLFVAGEAQSNFP